MNTEGHSNKDANKQLGQPNTEDVGDFMYSFRSALTSLDNAQGVGRNVGRTQDVYNPGSMDVMPFDQGAGTHQGVRPEELLGLVMGVSGAPYMDERLDEVEYEDESHMETGPDFVRMGYSRTTRGRGMYSQRSSRVGVQMMKGPGGVTFRSVRSSRMGVGGGMGGMSGALLLGIIGSGMSGLPMSQEYHDRYCPIHGTYRHHQGHNYHGHHHHESGNDGYNGPEIVELSDDDQGPGNKQTLALPAPNSSKAGGKLSNEEELKLRKNKNIVHGVTDKIRCESLEGISREKERPLDSSSKDTKTRLQLCQTSEKSKLRRKQKETISDNRLIYASGSRDESNKRVKIPVDASNLFKASFSATVDHATHDDAKIHDDDRSDYPMLEQNHSEETERTDSCDENLLLSVKTNELVTDICKENTDSTIKPLQFKDNHFENEFNRNGDIVQITSKNEDNNFRKIVFSVGGIGEGVLKSNTTKSTIKLTTCRQKEVADTGLLRKDNGNEMDQLAEKGGSQNLIRKGNRNANEPCVIGGNSKTFFNSTDNQNSYVKKEHARLKPEKLTTEQKTIVQDEMNKTFGTYKTSIDLKPNAQKREHGQLKQTKDLAGSSPRAVMTSNAHAADLGVCASDRTNERLATLSPIRGNYNPYHGSEISRKTQEEGTSYQMIKSHLPDDISQQDLTHILGVKSFDFEESRKLLDEEPGEPFPTTTIIKKYDHLEKAYQQFENLVNDMSTTPKGSKSRQVKQKNASPRLPQEDKVQKEKDDNENKFTQHDSEVSMTFRSGKYIKPTTSAFRTVSSGNYKTVNNTAGATIPLTHQACSGSFRSYASRCSSCAKVHVHCKGCDAILRTLCGNCEACHSTLSPNSNQSLNRANGNLTMEGDRSFKEDRLTRSEVNNSTLHQTAHGEHRFQSFENTRYKITSGPVPPKKPMRNKNATKGSTAIQSPNFTTRPIQKATNGAKTESSHHSAYYNDSNNKRQGSGVDRLSSLTEAMLNEGLVVKDVYPDGNCFFAAIVDQLRMRGEFYYTAKSLRIAAVNHLKANPNQEDGTPLLEFVSGHGSDHGGTWEGYLSRLRRDGEWADHIIISAISSVLKRRIVIHSIRSGQSINKTVMEPDCIIKLRDREQDNKSKAYIADDLGENAKAPEDEHKTSNESQADKNELFEDLLLGHIPEAHYVSLRYLDWEERLFRELRTRMDEPEKIITEYGHPSKEAREPNAHSNEDSEGQPTTHILSIPSVSRLPTSHNNFLLKYIRDGNFLKLGPFRNFSRPKQSETAQKLSKMWGVGDRNNDLESYLNLSTSVNYAEVQIAEDLFVEWLIVTPHDCMVTEQSTDLDFKSLRPVILGCKQGFLKLNPVSQRIWSNKVLQENGAYYLKHMHLATDHDNSPSVPSFIAFKSEWPREALACRDRLMKYRDILPDGIFQSKLLEGVRVVPLCSQGQLCHNEDCIEWKYTFTVIENVICCHILTAEERFCFKMLHHFLNYLFADRNIITTEHIKAVFFHTFEGLKVGRKEPNLFEIISHFLDNLERFLSDGNIPDFFVRPLNLIVNMDPEEVRWHHKRSHIAKEYYLVCMFLFLDQKGLMERFSLSKCFDSLLFNAFWKKGHNQNMCFEWLTILECREWVLEKDFRKAMSTVQMFQFEDLSFSTSSKESGFSDEYENYLHKQVLKGIPLQEQWLYAFYLESRAACPLIQHVNKGRDCAKLKVYFGEPALELMVLDNCSTLKTSEIELPLDICRQEGIASFAIHFFDCLKKQFRCPTSSVAADTSIHYFLCHHTDILLRDMVPKAGELGADDRHKIVIDSLFQLFTQLFQSYRTKQVSTGLSKLVKNLEKVTEMEPSAQRYEQLANIWTWTGNTLKSQEALEKASLIRQSIAQNEKSSRV